MRVTPLKGQVLVDQFKKGERLIGKIIIRDDNGTSRGIRPRWARVYSVGEGVTDVKPGQWIYIKHGKWTRGSDLQLNENDPEEVTTLWKVDYPESVVLVTDEEPIDDAFSIHDR